MEVFALVGPAGTGKSHRAIMISREYDVDAIIDDGLLIQGSRILAGSSAKREATKLGAVRRAIFADSDHRRQVRAALHALQPQRVLVLGTSDEMVLRIVRALAIPEPVRTIRIEEIASPEEIRLARRTRRLQGKHVIPAPTFEVKKSFSGFLVDPLRLIYRSKNARGDRLYVEKSTVRPTFSSLGRFYISDTVIALIAERQALLADGVTEVGRVVVESKTEGVEIALDLGLRYGVNIPQVLKTAQRHVRSGVSYMTALNVLRVDVQARRLTGMTERTDIVASGEGSPSDEHQGRD